MCNQWQAKENSVLFGRLPKDFKIFETADLQLLIEHFLRDQNGNYTQELSRLPALKEMCNFYKCRAAEVYVVYRFFK